MKYLLKDSPVPSPFAPPYEEMELTLEQITKLRGKIFLCTCGAYHPVVGVWVRMIRNSYLDDRVKLLYKENTRSGYRVIGADKPW